MGNLNRYIAYSERDRKNGHIIVRYVGLAQSKEHFKELAEKGMFDLSDYIIEVLEKNVRRRKNKDYIAFIEDAIFGGAFCQW